MNWQACCKHFTTRDLSMAVSILKQSWSLSRVGQRSSDVCLWVVLILRTPQAGRRIRSSFQKLYCFHGKYLEGLIHFCVLCLLSMNLAAYLLSIFFACPHEVWIFEHSAAAFNS